MKKTFFTAVVAVAVLIGGLMTTAPAAEAACSYNGYQNSRGKCGASWQQPNWQHQNQYQYQYTTSYSTEYLQNYIRQLQAILAQLQAMQDAQSGGGTGNVHSQVDVTTRNASNISSNQATLRGEVDFNNQSESTVYFRWGTSASNLNQETTNVVLRKNSDGRFTATITRLNRNTTYYFQAVAEDERGRRDVGTTLSFRTNTSGSSYTDDAYPEVETASATNITNRSARLNGSVDMRDYRNGLVFFVYGEDEDQVDDIAQDYSTYRSIQNDGRNLQKITVDNDLDTSRSYWINTSGLNTNSNIYHALCVEFEDTDGYSVISCGDTESFKTRN